MDRNSLKDMLVKNFDKSWDAFTAKHAQYRKELEQDLATFRTIYGDEVVNAMAANGEINLAIGAPRASSVSAPQPVETAPVAAPRAKKSKRRRARSAPETIGFSELKPHAVEAVKSLTGKRFTIQDVKTALKERGVKFEQKHLHLLLPRYISGIEVVDKQKRKGFPMNVYEVKGSVALVNYTTASKK